MAALRHLPVVLRAGLWALRARGVARRQLRSGGLEALRIPPPAIPYEGKAGVRLALELGPGNSLVDAAVRQAWCVAQGRPYDLVIGVRRPREGFAAQAWLSGDPAPPAGYVELARRAPFLPSAEPEG
jgi:hypothetical protein